METTVLSLRVSASVPWPARLVGGQDHEYNTCILQAGLRAFDSTTTTMVAEDVYGDLKARLETAARRVETLEAEQARRVEVERALRQAACEQERVHAREKDELRRECTADLQSQLSAALGRTRVLEADLREQALLFESRLIARENHIVERCKASEEERVRETVTRNETLVCENQRLSELLEQQSTSRESLVHQRVQETDKAVRQEMQSQVDIANQRAAVLEERLQKQNHLVLEAYKHGFQDGQKQSSANDAGKAGQNHVNEILIKSFPEAEVTDMSKKAGQGDTLLVMQGVEIMIETKNRVTHDQSEVVKFRDDLFKTKRHAGLYISLKDTTSSTRPSFTLETHPVPVVIIHDALRNPTLIAAAIRCLISLCHEAKRVSTERNAPEMAYDMLRSHVQQIVDGPLSRTVTYLRRTGSEMITKARRTETEILDCLHETFKKTDSIRHGREVTPSPPDVREPSPKRARSSGDAAHCHFPSCLRPIRLTKGPYCSAEHKRQHRDMSNGKKS